MNMSLRYIILLGFLLVLAPALLLLSYTDYSKAKQDLEDNFDFMVNQTAENVAGAYDLVEVGYRILSLSLENKMLNAFEPFKSAYFEVDGIVSQIDLSSLKAEFGDEFDYYIIDEYGVIIHTTFAKDLGLDFSKVAPSFNEKLQKIRLESRYQGDRISSETQTGNVRKYAYWGTPDQKYILEIGIKSSQFEEPLKNLDLLKISTDFEQFNPDLKSVIIFNGNGKVSNSPDFVSTEEQKKNILFVEETGERVDYRLNSASERWVYVKADVDEADGSASQGDKVIELVFDTSKLSNRLSSLATDQIYLTIFFIFVGGIMSLLLAQRISKPITTLNEVVGKISKGELLLSHVDSSSQHFIRAQQLRGDDWRGVQNLLFDQEVVVDTAHRRVKGLADGDVKADGVASVVLLLHVNDGILRIIAAVLGESLRDDEHSLCKCLNTALGATFNHLGHDFSRLA